MMLTTKGRYAVMAMADIAAQNGGVPVRLAEIAVRQGITVAYLEQIFSRLRRADLVKSIKGPGGGYVLADGAGEIKISDIIGAVDESIKMTRCGKRKSSKSGCVLGGKCLTHDLWDGLGLKIFEYLNSVSLADLCGRRIVEHPASQNIFSSAPERNDMAVI